MTATKLTPDEKQEIVRLYRETDSSTNQLATQFRVSSSTVLRLLQEAMSTQDYQESVKQKQSKSKRSPESKTAPDPTQEITQSIKESPIKPQKVLRQPQMEANQLDLMAPFLASATASKAERDIFYAFPDIEGLEAPIDSAPIPEVVITAPPTLIPELKPKRILTPRLAKDNSSPNLEISQAIAAPQNLVEEVAEAVAGAEFLDDEFDLEDDADDDLEDDEASEDLIDFTTTVPINPGTEVRILSLDDAEFPHTCYMVVDKSSEIVTRPLRDFGEIGKIPAAEEALATLPIFSNHRVAKRFVRQNQRIIKFSGELLYITHQKLAQKGITRLLFEGRVYAL
jgi:transposase-like protein